MQPGKVSWAVEKTAPGAPGPCFSDGTPDDTLPGEADFREAWKVVLERRGGAARVKKEGLLNQLPEEVFEWICCSPRFTDRLGLDPVDPMQGADVGCRAAGWRRRFMPGIMKAAPVGAASAR